MKTNYLVVTVTVKDGGFEYMNQTALAGERDPREMAEDYAKHFFGEEGSEKDEYGQYEGTDYRLLELDKYVEITKEEFDIINKYIY